jgi:alpha-mannosidase
LLNQTHDLLPGSGIGPIYKDAAKQYEEIFERGQRALDFSLQCIGLHVDTRGEGIPLVVYNPQSWERTNLVTAEISASSLPPKMLAMHGQEAVAVQVLKPARHDGNGERATIAFLARQVPQMGLKLYRIIPATGSSTLPTSQVEAGLRPRPYLENEFLKVEINPATGNMARLFDKKARREVFKGEGNFLVALEETTKQAMKSSPEYAGPAWDIGLTGVKWDMDKGASVELIEQGPVRASLRVVQRFRRSVFTCDISLVAGVPRVDVQMSIDWHERSTLLKVGFPVGVSSTQVTAEIPYGAIARDQTGREMVMGKWVDVSDAEYGVAILNNGRHGFDARTNVLRISAIRGPVAPDPRTDEGTHSFGYSVYPHQGGWKKGRVEFQALEFNSPLLALQEPIHNGSDDQTREGGASQRLLFPQNR